MKNYKAHLALLTLNVIYAASYGISKEIMEDHLPPFATILFRVGGATVLFWTLLIFTKKEKVAKKDFGLLALTGFFGVAANMLMFFEGLNHTTSINASIIMVGTPIIVLVLSRILLKERLSIQKIIGVSIGLAGATLLITSKSNSSEGATMYGNLLIFLNAASYGLYLVIVKPLMKKYHPLTIIRWSFTFGLLFVLPFGLSQFGDINWAFDTHDFWSLAFIIIAMTFITYLLTIYSLGKVNPTVVSAYIYLQPILATGIALLNQKEVLNFQTVLFALLIFVGVFLVSIPVRRVEA